MGELSGAAGLFAGQLGYQLRLLARSPRAVVAGLLLPLLILVLQHDGPGDGPSDRVAAVVGLAVLGAVSTSYVTHASGLVAAREAGVLKRWRATPLPPRCWFAARIAATLLLAVASGLATLLAGAWVDDLPLDGPRALGAVGALAAGAAAWAALGTAASAFVPSADAAWPILAVTSLPVVLLSFGGGDRPGWLSALARALPAQPVVDGATGALDGTGGWVPLTPRDALVLGAWALAGVVVARRRFRWEPTVAGPRRPRRGADRGRPDGVGTASRPASRM
jgi:ABC-2 type transport system permease protein